MYFSDGGRVIQIVIDPDDDSSDDGSPGDGSSDMEEEEGGEETGNLDTIDPHFSAQLNRNKERVRMIRSQVSAGVRALLDTLYASNPKANVVFATNWSESTLARMNLSSKELLRTYIVSKF